MPGLYCHDPMGTRGLTVLKGAILLFRWNFSEYLFNTLLRDLHCPYESFIV